MALSHRYVFLATIVDHFPLCLANCASAKTYSMLKSKVKVGTRLCCYGSLLVLLFSRTFARAAWAINQDNPGENRFTQLGLGSSTLFHDTWDT